MGIYDPTDEFTESEQFRRLTRPREGDEWPGS
jgi:hypothetical protein